VREALDRLLVGRTLAGRYRVEELIGTGGMSVVYRGHDLTLGRPVAVKVVSLGAADAEQAEKLRARFRREAGSAARIPPHPNVVQIHDFGTDDELGLDFIVMELLQGRDLKQAMASGPIPLPEAVRVLRETARGLAAGHRAGIVHRDVKPANVFLVGGEGDVEGVRVLDFGIAKPLEAEEGDDLTRTGQAPHSPAYAAPEQVDTHRPVTAASDVYSLGLIAYEMLSGERPFGDADRARIRAGEQLPPPERGRWSAVPASLRRVVERALRTHPESRWADAAALAEALAAVPDDDLSRTLNVAPTVLADDDTHLDGAWTPAASGPRDSPSPAVAQRVAVDAAPATRTPARPLPRLPRAAVIALPLILVALLGIWLARRRPPSPEATAASTAALPDSVPLTELDDEFLRLQGSVASTMPAAASASPAAAAPASDSAAPLDTARERAVIEQNVLDLHDAWVRGDLPRMMAHYAAEVHYHERSTSSHARVQSVIGQLLAKYPVRTITLGDRAITFPEPGEARALVMREWDYQGPSDHWTGRDRLLLVFNREGDAWKITTERRQTTYRSRHRRI
jgi:serine/threonine protein kinase